MFYLIAAILGSSSLTIILKLFQLKGVDRTVGITVNYLVGAVMAFLFAPKTASASEIIQAPWFPLGMLTGAMFMLSFMVYALSAQRSGVAITTISGRAAMAIPVIFAFTVLGETPTTFKIILLILLILSMPVILYKRKESNEKRDPSFTWAIGLPVAVFLFNGTNDTLVQYIQKAQIPVRDDNPIFMGTMFLAGAAMGIIYYLVERRGKWYRPTGRDLLWGTILGATNWVCMIGVLYALTRMDGSIFYALYYSGAIVCATIVGVWAFKERLTTLNYVGIVVAVAAIVLLSMQ